MITLEALKIAEAVLPTASPRAWLLALVTMAAVEPPFGSSMTTSVFTAPGCTREMVPLRRFRAENRAPSSSVTMMIDDDLIRA